MNLGVVSLVGGKVIEILITHLSPKMMKDCRFDSALEQEDKRKQLGLN
jgi:hypothetical protein